MIYWKADENQKNVNLFGNLITRYERKSSGAIQTNVVFVVVEKDEEAV